MMKHPLVPRSLGRPGGAGILLLLIAGFLWGGADLLEAQRPGADRLDAAALGELEHRPTQIIPRSGPPGTTVTVRGYSLPAITPVNIAFGGTRAGFEGLAFVLTTREGEVEESLTIPEWANRERIHRFIIFDAYFDPITVTDLFHVTDENGRVLREVEVTEAGATCAIISGVEQDHYWVVGDTSDFQSGDRMRVEAELHPGGECGDGPHLELVSVQGMP